MRTEILLCANPDAAVNVIVRFLQTQKRQVFKSRIDESTAEETLFDPVAALDVDGAQHVSWDEAIEREVIISNIPLAEVVSHQRHITFDYAAQESVETIYSKAGAIAGSVVRTTASLQGVVEIAAIALAGDFMRLSVSIRNTTPLPEIARRSRAEAQIYSFMSTHTLMVLESGEFISLLDPPTSLRDAARACANQATWPVLVGDESKRDTILSSPIILYDYPEIAPESKGPFFDGAEIDEMLALRVLTLTEDEKREMAAADPRTREMLTRCEAMTGADFGTLHGALRSYGHAPTALSEDTKQDLSVGCRVRLNPKTRGDVFDIALKGKLATIASIEKDFENRVHVAVTLLDDPGGDLGAAGFPGHRFFFSREEIEPVNSGDRQ
jgi:hydrogenase maturation protease